MFLPYSSFDAFPSKTVPPGIGSSWVYRFTGFHILVVLWSLMGCQRPATDPIGHLRDQIEDLFQQTEGVFALAFSDPFTGDTLFINEGDRFHAASTMKTPVMIEAFRRSAEGTLQLTDSIVLKNTFYSIVDSSLYSLRQDQDSDSLIYHQIGTRKTLYDLIYDMIIMSSNLATNLVIDLLDARQVTSTMRALGVPHIEVLRGVEDLKAFEAGLSNSTTALDLHHIMAHLAAGTAVSPLADQTMREILLNQKFRDVIPALLPDHVRVAHKTGSITGVHHDSGIVYLPDGTYYILVLLSRNLADFDKGTQMLAQTSRLIYDHVLQRH